MALFFQVNDVGHLSKVSLLLSVLRSLQLSQWSSARGGSNLPGHYCTDCTAAVHSFAFFGGSCGRRVAMEATKAKQSVESTKVSRDSSV